MYLRRWLITNTASDGQITVQPYPDKKPLQTSVEEQLLGYFKPCPLALEQADFYSAEAVFGFAFGYRMRQWSKGVAPTDPAEVEANRIPGANNAALAEQAAQLHLDYRLALYLQFEIADALRSGITPTCVTHRIDQGTAGVLKHFICEAKKKGRNLQCVVVVAHRHHFERCRLLLEDQGISRVLPPPSFYSGYDPLEAQPRVMSPEECIINDFVSMARYNKDHPHT
jgi:hypothetical protein